VHRTRIKICGITRPEDARAAAEAGADAIGLIFHPPAPRCLTLERARDILATLPAFVTPVGVFVNVPAEQATQTATKLGLRHIQLNGNEPPDAVRALSRFAVIKAVRVEQDRFADTLATWRSAVTDLRLTNLKGLVLETPGTGKAGGTGVPNDWETVRQHQRAGSFGSLPVIAAGGLTPETVGQIVRDIRPWAVDVSSGVEDAPGRKSAEKLRAFVEAVRKDSAKD
jgi:phosphoribosylanthranilate isomerase